MTTFIIINKEKPVPQYLGRSYQRTAEDEENDRLEREWKQRRNEEALRTLQRNIANKFRH